jgi:2-haloacid dehalogenase
MPKTLVFDVNETLLDLRALREPFRAVFGAPEVREEWFQLLLHQSFLSTITGPYVDFSTLGRQALTGIAETRGRTLTLDDRDRILGAMKELPPHGDANEALDRLQAAPIRLAALSNGTPEVLQAQLAAAGLRSYFDAVFSADAAGRLKPAPEPYEYVARELGAAPRDLCMVAAHAWDTRGALRAGWSAAFVARPGKRLAPGDPTPEVIGEDLRDVAQQVLDSLEDDDRL